MERLLLVCSRMHQSPVFRLPIDSELHEKYRNNSTNGIGLTRHCQVLGARFCLRNKKLGLDETNLQLCKYCIQQLDPVRDIKALHEP